MRNIFKPIFYTRDQQRPAWYYALAYFDFVQCKEVWYLFPLNLIIRYLWIVWCWWNALRGRPSRVDLYIMQQSSRLARQMSMEYRIKREAEMNEMARLNLRKLKGDVKVTEIKPPESATTKKEGKKK